MNENNQQTEKKKKSGCLIALAVVGVIGLLVIGGCVLTGGLFVAGVGSSMAQAEERRQEQLRLLETAQVSDIQPYGELADMFNLMSDFTDIQRDNKRAELDGAVVEWSLPVFEVSRSGDFYRIQTSSGRAGGRNYVGTFVEVYPRNDNERNAIEGLKTGDFVTVRGYIDGTSMRNIRIRPAIYIR